MGSKLAQLHLQRADAYGEIAKPAPNAQTYFQEKFLEELNECSDHLPPPVLKACKKSFDSHKHLLNSVDGPCFVHRDFRPGNILVQDGKLTGIIDWASGRFGFAEQDFTFIEQGLCPYPQAF